MSDACRAKREINGKQSRNRQLIVQTSVDSFSPGAGDSAAFGGKGAPHASTETARKAGSTI
jgi:hypothetical protein